MTAALLVLAVAVSGPSPTLQSYRTARAVLDAGIEAMGGAEALRGAGAVRRQMSGEWYGSGQGRYPEPLAGPTLQTPADNDHETLDSVIDYAAGRWAEERTECDETDCITNVSALDAEHSFETITYRSEKPFLHRYSGEERAALRTSKLRRYPEGALLMALDRLETLQWVGTGEDQGRAPEVISFSDSRGRGCPFISTRARTC